MIGMRIILPELPVLGNLREKGLTYHPALRMLSPLQFSDITGEFV
jgi:hypothetical protein